MDGQTIPCSSDANNRHNIRAKVEARPNADSGNGHVGIGDGQQICEKNGKEGERMYLETGGRLNPMDVPSIINHVTSFLPCFDLKRCRLLNKQWEEECSKYLRLKGLVKLTSKSSIDNFYVHFHKKPKCFQNFSFNTLNEDIEMNKFIDKFGPHMKCIKFDFSGENQHIPIKTLFKLIFTKLPNLQELSLVGCISDDGHFLPKARGKENRNSINTKNNVINGNATSEETYQGPSTSTTLPLLKYLEIFLYNSSGKDVSKHLFLIELLSCVPNLEKIAVPNVPRMLSFGMPLLHTLVITSDLRFDKLQHLEMDIALYNGLIDVLKSKGFPLKYLNAEINSTVSDESLHSLLITFGRTLETLQLKFPSSPVALSEFTSGTSFQCLKHLTLHGYKGPLKFIEQLRHLQTLEIIDNSFAVAMNRRKFSRPSNIQFKYKMIWTHWHDEAYVFDSINSSDVQLLRQFCKSFLNLTSLNLPHLNDNDLRVIYQTFCHSLQELTMENSLCSDYGLTGVHPEVLRTCERKGNADAKRTQPFIGNLTRLRRLDVLTPSIDLTDAAISYGITYCENLKVFVLRNAAAITDIGLLKAVDLLHLEKLETTMCANVSGVAVKYAMKKMTERGMIYIWNKYQSRLTNCCINRILNGKSQVTCIVP